MAVERKSERKTSGSPAGVTNRRDDGHSLSNRKRSGERKSETIIKLVCARENVEKKERSRKVHE